MELILDGYNLIGADRGLVGALEHKRNRLVQQLARYQKIKGFGLTVVFDGWRSGTGNEVREKKDGVAVIYSRLGERADSVIVRIARENGSGCVIVTSDREIRSAVERFGAVAISAGDFNRILRSLEQGPAQDGFDEFDEAETGASKSGNPNRLSKAERRRNEKLRKLKL